jgi:Domain of unknown function (DUF4386)
MGSAGPSQPNARFIGVVYLLFFVAVFLAVYLSKGIVVPLDAAATASNLLAHETLYRAAFAVNLLSNALYIAVTALFYRLFAPVNRDISLIAAFLSLSGCTIQIVGGLLQLAPLSILPDAQLASVASQTQIQTFALVSLKSYALVYQISLVLFAFYDLLLGYLIVKSGFLPRILGAPLIVAGFGWMMFLWPPLAKVVSPIVLPFGALAEIALMLWLIVKGVGTSRSVHGA